MLLKYEIGVKVGDRVIVDGPVLRSHHKHVKLRCPKGHELWARTDRLDQGNSKLCKKCYRWGAQGIRAKPIPQTP